MSNIVSMSGYQSRRSDAVEWALDASFTHNAGVFFSTDRNRHSIVSPPYRYERLQSILNRSSSLRRGVAVMARRIGAYGHELVPTFPKMDGANEAELGQKAELDMFLAGSGYASGGLNQMRYRSDLEFYGFGNSAWKLVRDRAGRLACAEYVDAVGIRIIRPSEDSEVTIRVPLFLPSSGSVMWVDRPTTFVRYRAIENRVARYYKQVGDPRPLNARTGEARPEGAKDFGDDEAQELLMFRDHWPGSEFYGVPRWVATQDEQLSEINLCVLLNKWSEQGLIDVRALVATNGTWSDETKKEIAGFIANKARGVDNAFQVMLLNALGGEDILDTGLGNADEGVRAPSNNIQDIDLSSKLHLDKLIETIGQIKSQNRSYAFGLPPSLMGIVEEDSRATAQVTKEAAEEGIFIPDRKAFDATVQMHLAPHLDVTHWRMRTKHAQTEAAASAVNSLAPMISGGAVTINQLVELANKVTGLEWPTYDPAEHAWADVPLALAPQVAAGAMTPEQANADESAVERSARQSFQMVSRLAGLQRQFADAETGGEILRTVKEQAERMGIELPPEARDAV